MKSRDFANWSSREEKKIKILDLDNDARQASRPIFATLLRFFGDSDWKALSLRGCWMNVFTGCEY